MTISTSRLDSFQRFEQLRQLAQDQVVSSPQNKLARLIESKRQSMLETQSRQTPNSGRVHFKKAPSEESAGLENGLSGLFHQGLKKANELLMYDGKINTTSFTEGTQKLGNYIDLVG